jgi:hypothetical protein
MRASLQKRYSFGMEFLIATKVGKVGLSRYTNSSSITIADVVFFFGARFIHQSALFVMLVAPSHEKDS